MEVIGQQKIWSFCGRGHDATTTTNSEIRRAGSRQVDSFLDLAKMVAELQFKNTDHVLLFRGQTNDYRNNSGETTLKPSLFRPAQGTVDVPGMDELSGRFQILKQAERELVVNYNQARLQSPERLERHRVLRWSILQHYEICRTPLLDVTHSLRIAASFASFGATNAAFIFVLGVPNLSGAVTASAEAGVQIIRLASVCPPAAVRPHIQEGYLVGEYPEMPDYDQKEHYHHQEIDFGRRLVAKFHFDPKVFWRDAMFPQIGEAALRPDADQDPLQGLASQMRARWGT